MKRIISLFIAAIIVCIALPVTASADYDYTLTLAGGESANIIAAGKVLITSSGTVALGADITVNVDSSAEVIWEANVTGTHKVTFEGDGTVTITGRIENTSGTAVAASTNLIVNGGTITGTKGIDCLDGTITINGGTITSTGDGGDAAVDITMGTYDPVVTIGGTAIIDGGTTNAVRIGNTSASLLIRNGTFSGENGLNVSGFNSLIIEGGSFSSAEWNAIAIGYAYRAIQIKPNASTPITMQGDDNAIFLSGATPPTFSGVNYYYAGDNADGTGKVLYDNSVDEFTFPSDYKYVQFHAVNPEPPVEEVPDPGVPPHLSQPSYNPSYTYATPEVTPIYEPKEMNIDVIAIINKSGSVNSMKTRLEVLKAARTKGVTQITLILPEDCTGISTAAIKKCVKAAGKTPMLLAYDDVKIKLTENTKQVLTKLYYTGR